MLSSSLESRMLYSCVEWLRCDTEAKAAAVDDEGAKAAQYPLDAKRRANARVVALEGIAVFEFDKKEGVCRLRGVKGRLFVVLVLGAEEARSLERRGVGRGWFLTV
jgi:hypothetical protein